MYECNLLVYRLSINVCMNVIYWSIIFVYQLVFMNVLYWSIVFVYHLCVPKCTLFVYLVRSPTCSFCLSCEITYLLFLFILWDHLPVLFVYLVISVWPVFFVLSPLPPLVVFSAVLRSSSCSHTRPSVSVTPAITTDIQRM